MEGVGEGDVIHIPTFSLSKILQIFFSFNLTCLPAKQGLKKKRESKLKVFKKNHCRAKRKSKVIIQVNDISNMKSDRNR